MLRKITLIIILLSIPLQACASDEKGWYPFIQNKGWYPSQGQGVSSESSGEQEKPLVQTSTQPGMSSTPSTTGAAQTQGTAPTKQSGWFNQ